MHTYLAVYFGSVILALLITPGVIWFAHRLEAIDHPGVRKVHSRRVPRIGGIAIFISAMCLVLAVLFIDNVIGQAFRNIYPQFLTFILASTFIFAVGLYDDLKDIRALTKLSAQIIAALAVCMAGIRIESLAFAEGFVIDFGWFSWPLTMLWIVGITNAVNLSDGLDGLAAGISAIACATIAAFAIYSGQVVMAVLMLALCGALSGFLVYNFNPAKIFMGDSGSLFMGFIIAAGSVMCTAKSQALVGLTLPILALGVPIFDTFFSMLRRFLERRSMFSPDMAHFHHRLLDLGLKQKHVVIIIYVVTGCAAGFGMFMMLTRDFSTVALFVSILLLLLVLFRVVGSVRLRQTIEGIRKKYTLSQKIKKEKETFEHLQLHFRRVSSLEDWTNAIQKAAEAMEFAWISVKFEDSDGTENTTVWRNPDFTPGESRLLINTAPVRNRFCKSQAEIEIALPVNGSLELASERSKLFNRLLEEQSKSNVESLSYNE